jgi:hypothetical protein
VTDRANEMIVSLFARPNDVRRNLRNVAPLPFTHPFRGTDLQDISPAAILWIGLSLEEHLFQ